MPLYIFLVLLLNLIYQSFSHVLIPPFLPDVYRNQYYEQKFKISQLDTAQFKITGLPQDIFWTINGTIFGTPSNFGQWTINISYDSLTQSGNYQTIFVIKNNNISKTSLRQINNQKQQMQIIFPQNLILEKNKEQQINFRLKNAVQPALWRFVTLPKGVIQKQSGKLSVKIQKQGIYILRIQATDLMRNTIQACVTLNIQSSKQRFIQSYAANTIYEPSQSLNRLLQINQKQTQVSKQLNQAVKKLGQQNTILKQNQQIIKRISNNLIQLQNQVRSISEKIEQSLKDKKVKQQKLKQAYEILKNAQDNLNLGVIQQQSTNNLLAESQVQKAQALLTYNAANQILQNQLKVLNQIDNKLTAKQKQKQNSVKLLQQTKNKYNELAQTIINQQKQVININQQVSRSYQQVLKSQNLVKAQQAVLIQQQNKYSAILRGLNQKDSQIQTLQQQIDNLSRQKDLQTNQALRLSTIIKSLQTNQLFNLQQDIKNNDLSIQNILFESIKQWNGIGYQSQFVTDYINQIQFAGCSKNQYPSIQGVFTIKQASLNNFYYQAQSGHRILFGNCTKTSSFKPGDTVIISGYAAQGVIHANKIDRQ